METISQLIRSHRYRITKINNGKHFLVIAVENVHPCICVPFDLVPARDLLELTQEPDQSHNHNHSLSS